ncbi:MAG: trypsin-like peptidase domain-containing protein [Candidatus Babeliales bacterium]
MDFKKLVTLFLALCTCHLDAKNFAELKQIYTDGYGQLIQSYFSPNKATPNLHAPWMTNDSTRFSWEELSLKHRDAVVQFFTYTSDYNFIAPYKTPMYSEGRGSGFITSDDGYILTNFHVIEDGIKVVVQLPSLGKEKFDIDFIGGSPELDVALWKFTDQSLKKVKQGLGVAKLNYLELANSDEVHDAEKIMELGFPLGQENLKCSIGPVSGHERVLIPGCYAENEFIQTTTPSNPGNSGGPIVNKQGLVIGIAAAGVHQADGINWFIPINNVIAALKDFNNKEIIRNPWWGLHAIKTTPAMLDYLKNPNDGGIYVTSVEKGSLLAEAGICVGDVLYTVFDKKIDHDGYLNVPWKNDKVHLMDILIKIPSESSIWFDIYRNGEKKTITITANNRSPRAIDYLFPWYEPTLDYEMIAGMIIVPLTKNLIAELHRRVDSKYLGFLAPYEKVEKQIEPRLCVTVTMPNSLADVSKCFEGINSDRILSEVNGIPVKTIADFRKAVLLSKEQSHLVLKMEGGTFAAFAIKDILEQEDVLSQAYQFKKSHLIDQLAA